MKRAARYERYEGHGMPRPLGRTFWVGVREGRYPSEPVPRNLTSCYSPRPVYEVDGGQVFECGDAYYHVPECEGWAIQDEPCRAEPDHTYGRVVRIENVPVIEIPRTATETERPRTPPEEILRRLREAAGLDEPGKAARKATRDGRQARLFSGTPRETRRPRKQKTEKQRAKAKATVERLVGQSRKETVDEFVRLIERGGLNWVKEWSIRHAGYDVDVFDPWNPVTGTHYSGGNRFSLSMHCFMRDMVDNRFCTWNQARKMGWEVREDATPLIIEKWMPQSWYQRDEKGEVVTDEDGNKLIGGTCMKLVSCFKVYSFTEIEGAPELERAYDPKAPSRVQGETDMLMDALKESSRCPVSEVLSQRAYYSPTTDRITVPKREEFTSIQAALRTLLHEMGHSTGHESALSRNLTGRRGSTNYAFEELIAELCAVFTASYLDTGLAAEDEDKHKRNHAAYLKSWLGKLQGDPDYLYKAAASAAKASDYIIKRLVRDHPEYERTTDTLEAPEPKAA